MEANTEQEAYDRRFIDGYTIAVAPEKIEAAKLMLQQSWLKFTKHLSDGKAEEVYQLQVQLFPVESQIIFSFDLGLIFLN